jgi:uncharacterized protein (DUF2062 family)
VPLWFASGFGAVSRRIMGSTAIGGMMAGAVVAIFFIPVTFHLIERTSKKRTEKSTALPPHEARVASHG